MAVAVGAEVPAAAVSQHQAAKVLQQTGVGKLRSNQCTPGSERGTTQTSMCRVLGANVLMSSFNEMLKTEKKRKDRN